jgi:integrase
MPEQFIIKGEKNPRRPITDEEFERLVSHADDDFRDVLICAHESAIRSSEIAKLTTGQVHLKVRHISGRRVDYIDLGIFDAKIGARQTVPVRARLKEVLQKRLENLDPEDPVFTDQLGAYKNILISKKMKQVCERAGGQHGDNLLNKKGERVGGGVSLFEAY